MWLLSISWCWAAWQAAGWAVARPTYRKDWIMKPCSWHSCLRNPRFILRGDPCYIFIASVNTQSYKQHDNIYNLSALNIRHLQVVETNHSEVTTGCLTGNPDARRHRGGQRRDQEPCPTGPDLWAPTRIALGSFLTAMEYLEALKQLSDCELGFAQRKTAPWKNYHNWTLSFLTDLRFAREPDWSCT